MSIEGDSADPNMAGVVGRNTVNGVGIWGEANPNGRAIVGVAVGGAGVWGHTQTGRGVVGVSDTGGTGVWGESKSGAGVVGVVNEGAGAGVSGRSNAGDGLLGNGRNGVSAVGSQTGVYAKGTVNAGFFEGNVFVTGDVGVGGDITLANADCAEDFDVDGDIEPGTVVVLTDEGTLRGCSRAFDTRVAGVVSGAGDYRPGIVLDRQRSHRPRQPVALLGKVYCKVDAGTSPIAVGDLLTTSDTPGHAMKATDQQRAFGAVLGKALRPLASGSGLIPILVALQ